MSAPLSVGLSKSGAVAKASTPVSVTLNLPASAPPFFDQVRSSFSASAAASVATAVVFSATDCGEVVVITGAVLLAASADSASSTVVAEDQSRPVSSHV